MIILSFKDSTYNAQFNLCFYLFCRPFPEVPAETFRFKARPPSLLADPFAACLSLPAQRPKNSENQTIKELCPVSQRRSSLCLASADWPFRDTRCRGVFAEPLAHLRVRCDQREGHFSGTGSGVNIVFELLSQFLSKLPRTFCRSPARFAALDLSSETSALQRAPGLSTEPKTDPFEPAFTSVLAPAFSLSRSSAFAAGRDT